MRRRNYIFALKSEEDLWITDPARLQVMAVNFFRSLFTSANIATDGYRTRGRFPLVEDSVLAHLSDSVTESESLPLSSVADMVDMEGNWRWVEIDQVLPAYVLLRLAAIKGPLPSFVADSIAWAGTNSGKFSVTSAYTIRKGTAFGKDDRDWNMIFGATCWFLWLYRNALIYSTEGVESWSVLSKVRNWYDSVAAHMQCANVGQQQRVDLRHTVRW
ncbi:hypothetical protein V6N13_071199 [Hibiscus sabdariffa]